MSTLPEPTAIVRATEYRVTWLPDDDPDCFPWSLTIEWRAEDLWAVCWAGHCLSKGGKWDLEPLSSSRTDAWKARHRFDLATATALAKKHGPRLRINGYTVADLLVKKALGAQ